jgi:transposase
MLATGKVSHFRLADKAQVIGYTRPRGQGLLAWLQAGSHFELSRYRLTGPGAAVLPAPARLDEIPGISLAGAQGILAEIGLDMTRFLTAGHLVSWAKLSPRTIQSGAKNRSGKTGKGNLYLEGILGEAAAAAARTDTFLGERYRRLVKRIGKLKALVAVARFILVIVWHLLSDPAAQFCELGPAYHASRTDTQRKARGHIRQLEALGYTVTLTRAA